MNKKKAKAQAQSFDFLDDLGTSKEEFQSVDDGLETIITEFIQRVKNNIEDADLINSGNIQNIEMIKNGDSIEVSAPIYLLFQDKGVNGTEVNHNSPFSYGSKMPPIDVFVEYIKSKGNKSRNNKKFFKDKAFKDMSDNEIKSLAYSMAKSIQKKGIEPKYIYSKELGRLEEELKASIPNVIISQFLDKINKKQGG